MRMPLNLIYLGNDFCITACDSSVPHAPTEKIISTTINKEIIFFTRRSSCKAVFFAFCSIAIYCSSQSLVSLVSLYVGLGSMSNAYNLSPFICFMYGCGQKKRLSSLYCPESLFIQYHFTIRRPRAIRNTPPVPVRLAICPVYRMPSSA